MAWWTNFISSVQLFPSRARPPQGQMAPKQLLVSQYIWRHSWNDNSDGATSSSYTKALFRTFPLVLVCYKQNLMCENKIKASPFTPVSFLLLLLTRRSACPTSAPRPETDGHSAPGAESLRHARPPQGWLCWNCWEFQADYDDLISLHTISLKLSWGIICGEEPVREGNLGRNW